MLNYGHVIIESKGKINKFLITNKKLAMKIYGTTSIVDQLDILMDGKLSSFENKYEKNRLKNIEKDKKDSAEMEKVIAGIDSTYKSDVGNLKGFTTEQIPMSLLPKKEQKSFIDILAEIKKLEKISTDGIDLIILGLVFSLFNLSPKSATIKDVQNNLPFNGYIYHASFDGGNAIVFYHSDDVLPLKYSISIKKDLYDDEIEKDIEWHKYVNMKLLKKTLNIKKDKVIKDRDAKTWVTHMNKETIKELKKKDSDYRKLKSPLLKKLKSIEDYLGQAAIDEINKKMLIKLARLNKTISSKDKVFYIIHNRSEDIEIIRSILKNFEYNLFTYSELTNKELTVLKSDDNIDMMLGSDEFEIALLVIK